MKILLVSELFPPDRSGGGEISAMELANELGRKHEVMVFTPSYGLPMGFDEAGDFRIFRYPNKFTPIGSLIQQKLFFFVEMTKNLATFVRTFKPDIIHAQNAMSIPAVAEVGKKHRTVAIAHVRDHRFECFTSRVLCSSRTDATLADFARCVGNPFLAIIFPYAKLVTSSIQRALKKCGRAIVVSNYLKSELLRRVDIDARACYAGVNLEKIARIEPNEIEGRFCEQGNTIFYAGGLRKFKGIFALLDGFLQVSREIGTASLLVAGDGPDREAVCRFIETNNLRDKVKLLGFLSYENTISVIKSSNIVVVPSLLPEGASRVVVEALACAKPVLGSDRGAVPEMIGNAGVTVPPLPYEIARGILNILGERDKLNRLSALAKARSRKFSITRSSRETLRFYEEWLRR